MSEEKRYGASILEVDEREIAEVDEEATPFDDMKNYSKKDIEDMRSELMETNSGKVQDKVYVDSISGIKSSEKIDSSSDEIHDIIDSKEKSDKMLTKAGIELLKDILGSEPTDEEVNGITSYFDKLISVDDIFTVDISVLETILGARISNKLNTISEKNGVSKYKAVTSLLSQLYKSYSTVVQFNDDIDELYNLVNSISNMDFNNMNMDDPNSIVEQYKVINNATEQLKKLDDRNKKLKNDYKVTDFDILILEDVKDCLNEAISFKRVYDKIDSVPPKKFKKDIKNISELKQSIGNWISDLKNDPDTLFTFPVNDFLTPIQSVDGMVDYIKGFIMIQDKHEYYDNLKSSEDNPITDLVQHFIDNGIIDNEDLENYERSAIILLYFLSKTFKMKKIKDNNDRRVLSYTLDIISKLSNTTYASILMQLVNYYSEKFNIGSYDHIKINNDVMKGDFTNGDN